MVQPQDRLPIGPSPLLMPLHFPLWLSGSSDHLSWVLALPFQVGSLADCLTMGVAPGERPWIGLHQGVGVLIRASPAQRPDASELVVPLVEKAQGLVGTKLIDPLAVDGSEENWSDQKWSEARVKTSPLDYFRFWFASIKLDARLDKSELQVETCFCVSNDRVSESQKSEL